MYNEVVTAVQATDEAKLREFILTDFETYGLTAEDLDFWRESALAVGKFADYLDDLAFVILGEDDYLDGLM